MKYIRKFAIALCASIAIFGVSSCVDQCEELHIIEENTTSEDNSWFFFNGVSSIEMAVGDSKGLPTEEDGVSCSWKSDDETVATVVTKDSSTRQYLKAVGVGTATVSDENSKYKIYVTVKEREQ